MPAGGILKDSPHCQRKNNRGTGVLCPLHTHPDSSPPQMAGSLSQGLMGKWMELGDLQRRGQLDFWVNLSTPLSPGQSSPGQSPLGLGEDQHKSFASLMLVGQMKFLGGVRRPPMSSSRGQGWGLGPGQSQQSPCTNLRNLTLKPSSSQDPELITHEGVGWSSWGLHLRPHCCLPTQHLASFYPCHLLLLMDPLTLRPAQHCPLGGRPRN